MYWAYNMLQQPEIEALHSITRSSWELTQVLTKALEAHAHTGHLSQKPPAPLTTSRDTAYILQGVAHNTIVVGCLSRQPWALTRRCPAAASA
jgi:hypothetical protein